ncbi:MAG: hypothetical protein JSW00_06245 [Thermoplasmata archaeon]|nr:MAG: hypothetical protein JSW00_06245 [Thermoplasmata archaeon]
MNDKQPHKKQAERFVLALLVAIFISIIIVQVGTDSPETTTRIETIDSGFTEETPPIKAGFISGKDGTYVRSHYQSLYAGTLGERTFYVPLSSDAYMNALDVTFEDIEKIEAIRGPEETLWIANNVTGLLWQVNKNIDISIVGQNLLDRIRPELGNDNVTATEPIHAIFVKLTWRF